ncbi:MAG: hypothetical protein AAF802_01830 [Planctomycetota bacterium]
MSDDKPAKVISMHAEVPVWRLQQLAKQIKNQQMLASIERLTRAMLPGQTIWISGEQLQSFETEAKKPSSQTSPDES